MDVAAASMEMRAAQLAVDASTMALKNSMEHMEEISAQIIDQLLTLSVGPAMHSALDLYV